ncbi:MAG: NADH-quinone oxidoreductase subunit J [Bacteroidetes bacterium]|nr:NADH-quinone oxidoreductase subunit J [Bacteroidota bacterium]
MSASAIIFYIISAIILGGGILAVTSLKIFRAAIYLLFSLLGIAGLYFYLNYEFIAAVQIVVYVGGIVVLIIFSIFLTHASGDEMEKPVLWRAIFAALATVFATTLCISFINEHEFIATTNAPIAPSVRNIGLQMLSTTEHGFILPFEVVSMLLLSALIGCIVIAIKIKSPTNSPKGS